VKAVTENQGLNYYNMLAVCSGNEQAPEADGRRHKKRFFTCDKKREDATLKVNPMDQATIDTIYYSSDGAIRSVDREIDHDLNTHLNLNCSFYAVTLPKNRQAVLEEVQRSVVEHGGDILHNCITQLRLWEQESDPKTPYIGIAIWWLKKQIQILSKA
jgi:hypothetical protein